MTRYLWCGMRTSPPDTDRWTELDRTAVKVRSTTAEQTPAPARTWRRRAWHALYVGGISAVCAIAVHAATSTPPVAHADGTADGALFALTNQDRASNGVRSLAFSGTLSAIGEGAQYHGCGFTVYGRSVDMINRNYFAHPILGCGQYVFSIMSAYGIHYQSAGENIGWNVGGGADSAAANINVAFMNSPDHRANILNGNYTEGGMGSDNSGSRAWSGGGGGAYQDTWMFSEEFAQVKGSAPPPPPPPPPPHPSGGGSVPRNNPAPAAPKQAPASTAVPTPAPTPAPTETPRPHPTLAPTPFPTAFPTIVVPPGEAQTAGLLYDSVESILASYLIG